MILNPRNQDSAHLCIIISCLLCMGISWLLTAGNCWSAQTEGYRQIFATGYVDWLKGRVVAQGKATVSNAEMQDYAQAIARRSALMKARGNLLHLLQKVRIDSNALVADIMQQNKEAEKVVQALVHNSKIFDESFEDNATKVTVGLSLRGKFSKALIPQGSWYEKIAYDAGLDLEKHKEDLQEIKSSSAPALNATQERAKSKLTRLTGLIVDARGVDTAPSLLCRLFTEQGQLIYDPQMVRPESAYAQGMAGYTQDMNQALQSSRVGNNPLVVRAVGTLDIKASQLVIRTEEAQLVRQMKKYKEHLQSCRVVIVLGPSDQSELVEFPLY